MDSTLRNIHAAATPTFTTAVRRSARPRSIPTTRQEHTDRTTSCARAPSNEVERANSHHNRDSQLSDAKLPCGYSFETPAPEGHDDFDDVDINEPDDRSPPQQQNAVDHQVVAFWFSTTRPVPRSQVVGMSKEQLNTLYPPIKAENNVLATRHLDLTCQGDPSMRGTDAVVRTLANIIATFGPQRVRADVESASLNRLLNLAAVVEQQVETPEICSHTRTRTLVLHPRQAAEYLRRQRPACPGAFPPALVDCEEAAKQGALLHTGYVRDLLEFVQRHDLVLVYENQFVSASDNVTFAADETHVVLDTRSAADAHVLHKIRTLARRRHGTDFAHPDSGFDLVNPQPWRASSVQLDGAARIAAVTATLRRTSPPTTVPAEALPFNKDASLHVIRQLGTKLQHRVLAMPRSTSADLTAATTLAERFWEQDEPGRRLLCQPRIDTDEREEKYPSRRPESTAHKTRPPDVDCQADVSMRDLTSLIGYLDTIGARAAVAGIPVRAFIERAPLDELVGAAPVFASKVCTPTISCSFKTRSFALTLGQAVDYLGRRPPLRHGALTPALFEDFQSDKLQLAVKSGLVLVFENGYGRPGASAPFSANSTLVVVDGRTRESHADLDALHRLAIRCTGKNFGHTTSRTMFANPNPAGATTAQLKAAGNLYQVVSKVRRSALPLGGSAVAAPFNRDGSLHIVRQLGQAFLDRVRAMAANTARSTTRSVAVTEDLALGGKTIKAEYRAWSGTPEACRQILRDSSSSSAPPPPPPPPESVIPGHQYAAVLEAFGRLYPKRGGCLFTLLAGVIPSAVPTFSSVVWTIKLDGVVYNSYMHTSDSFSPATLALAPRLRLDPAVARMALLRLGRTFADITVSNEVSRPEPNSVRVRREYLELPSISRYFVTAFRTLGHRPDTWSAVGLDTRLPQLAKHCGVVQDQLDKLWLMSQRLACVEGLYTCPHQLVVTEAEDEVRALATGAGTILRPRKNTPSELNGTD
ncbi:uncharacterized protein EHS24_000655 [Apiotrichum porosum]|uniref:Uncharacterized protein n=1 Tax=Apiotrichum porosum TaxID=105984 RepID=A0A427YAM1_9TREE|nr:uncharacterized protein EHS24_000655 [Apiotrichum porosum]RSH88128.1 hypothetical protein EHS24_000655 [Apiotrichum porosum]